MFNISTSSLGVCQFDKSSPSITKRFCISFTIGTYIIRLESCKLIFFSSYYPDKSLNWNIPETSTFPFFSMRSPCAHRLFNCTPRFASFALTVHKTLIVRSAFIYRSLLFHSFSFETPKWKNRSFRVTRNLEKNTWVKVQENL